MRNLWFSPNKKRRDQICAGEGKRDPAKEREIRRGKERFGEARGRGRGRGRRCGGLSDRSERRHSLSPLSPVFLRCRGWRTVRQRPPPFPPFPLFSPSWSDLRPAPITDLEVGGGLAVLPRSASRVAVKGLLRRRRSANSDFWVVRGKSGGSVKRRKIVFDPVFSGLFYVYYI
jgi:hypothetical protein